MKKLEETERVVSLLKSGKIGVLPTDTLYALAGSALDPVAVERIYTVRKRDADRPLIILIHDGHEIERFGISAKKGPGVAAQRYWPGKVSIVLPCPEEKFAYLHRGGKTLAFRVPDKQDLLAILKETGPLVAPSANPQDKLPALTILEARNYFGDNVDFYVDAGMLVSEPSTLIEIRPNKILILREGAVKEIVRPRESGK